MALTYSSAIAALLNNGSQQVLPISMANLIELAKDKTKFGTGAQSVQDALGYLAGSFEHANTVAQTAQNNAYAYVGEEINKLDAVGVGSTTDAGHDKFISYIYQENGYIHAFAQDMSAANVAYNSGLDGRATVAAELEHINATIAKNLDATTLKLVKVNGEKEEAATTVSADGSTYKLKQGSKDVASFNIEKDSFVKSGSVVRGTKDEHGNVAENENGEYYIKLEIKTHDDTGAAEHTLYIPAESLVDAYTANNGVGDSNSVTVTVNQEHNTISAVIKAGGVGTTELADSAVTTAKIANGNVTTAKIADGNVTTEKIAALAVTTAKIADNAVTTAKITDKNVTKEKLADDVQASLDLADTAVQNITEGSTPGTISVKGADVKVKDLKAIATTGAAADVTVATIDNLDALANLGEGKHVDDVQEALTVLAGKVKAINDGAVTSVNTSVVDNGNDAQNAVNISMTPIEATNGAVTVTLTHNLGSAAALDYDMKTATTPVSQAFWESFK